MIVRWYRRRKAARKLADAIDVLEVLEGADTSGATAALRRTQEQFQWTDEAQIWINGKRIE